MLTSARQIANALGVAIAGALFLGVLGDGSGAHAYDRAFAAALGLERVTPALSAVLARRVAAADPALAASAADSVPRVMAAPAPEVNRRAA